MVQTLAKCAVGNTSREKSFNHLSVRWWFRHLHITILHLMEMDSFNHLSVRGWFRLIKKAVFGDVIGY